MTWTNLTASEELRLTGAVTGERLEKLLDCEAQVEKLDDVGTHIDEALAQFPKEDFIGEHKKRLLVLRNKLRGDRRAELDEILEALDDLAGEITNSADYGREELNLARAALSES